MSLPSVTFVMAARNAALTVKRAVESVLQQDYSGRVDVVVVDDASEDDTSDIVSQYPDVVLLRNPRQLGRSLSRNRALSLVETSLVAIQDADDYSEPKRLTATAGLAEGRMAIVGGQVAWTDPVSGPFKGGAWATTQDETHKLLLQGRMPLAHPTMLIPTKLIQAVDGYSPKFPVGEDLDLLLRVKAKMPSVPILNTPEVVVEYQRLRTDKLTYMCRSAYWRQQVMNANSSLCPQQAQLTWVKNSIDGYVRQRVRAARASFSRSGR